MICKQSSWRSSKLLSVILLLSLNSLFGMDPQAQSDQNETFEGYTHQELQGFYEQAPNEVKAILRKVKHPNYKMTPQVRGVFFRGEPGTGKSTSAVMVAYMLRDSFEHELIEGTRYTGGNRGEATERLRDSLEDIMSSVETTDKGIVIIFDESQEFLDYANDSHYDTASTGRFLASWIDANRMNSKLFFIMTFNDDETFPEPIQSRMRGNILEFTVLMDPAAKIKAFKDRLAVRKLVLDSSCDDQVVVRKISEVKGWSGRDFDCLVSAIVNRAFQDEVGDSEVIVVTQAYFEDGLAILLKDKEHHARKTFKSETDLQQRQRHHQERMDFDLELQAHQKAPAGATIGFGLTGPNVSFNISRSPGIHDDEKEIILRNAVQREPVSNENTSFATSNTNTAPDDTRSRINNLVSGLKGVLWSTVDSK